MHYRTLPAALLAALILFGAASVNHEVTARPGPTTELADSTGTKKKGKKQSKAVTVYVTRTGKKYHADGCGSLSRSQIPISLEEAKAGYDPCSKCNPPE